MPAQTVSAIRTGTKSRRGSRDEVVPYDFRRPTKLSREHVRLLQRAYETFARRLTTLLTSGLRELCQVSVTDITQQTYDEYTASLPAQTLMVPVSIEPLPGTGIVEFSLPVALAAIDHMLGGPGAKQQARTLTDIEVSLLRGILDQIIGALRLATEPVLTMQPVAGAIEYNPQFIQACGGNDVVVVAEFDMSIGRESCRLTVCLPLAPLLPRLGNQRPRAVASDHDDPAAARALRARLGDVPVQVDVRFQPVSLSPAHILSLAVGDVVALGHRVGAPLVVQTGGVTFAHAIAGKSGSRLAALVIDNPLDPTKEHA